MPETFLTGETCKLYAGDGGSPEVFTAIGQLIDVDAPEMGKEAVERTFLGSPTQRFRPSKIKNSPEVAFTVQYDPANALHAQMITDALGASPTRNWKLGLDNGAATNWPGFAFPAWVKNAKTEGIEDKSNVNLKVALQVDGAVTTTVIAAP